MSSVSIVINTNGRAASLAEGLRSLRALDHEDIEVIVVTGPDDDGLDATRDEFSTDVLWLRCPERNLSMSRNIGIAASSGEIVAFIDDDAQPEPGWLAPIVAAFDDPEVAAAGGPVFDYTGARLQTLYNVVTRGGRVLVSTEGPNPTEIVNAPDSWAVPSLLGTNSGFRRRRLVEVGGFDEEYEYYLDETDLCVRLIDRGWKIALLDNGFVYHKYLPSNVRSVERVVSNWFPIMKNLVYFAHRHGASTGSPVRAAQDVTEYVRGARESVVAQMAAGLAPSDAERRLDEVLAQAPQIGKQHAEAGPPRVRPAEFFARRRPFLRFGTHHPPGRRLHLCFFSQEYPPGPVSGIGRVIHELAVGLAERGHVVRVLTRGADEATVDLEEGVWVHRVPVTDERILAEDRTPKRVWAHAAEMLRELERIDEIRPIDVVQIPNWDSEGASVLEDGAFTTSLGMYTPLATLCDVDGRVDRSDPEISAMIDLERRGYLAADGLLACGMAIVEEVEAAYGIALDGDRLSLVPHGLPAVGSRDAATPAVIDTAAVDILLVGRLEPRKGVDVLLDAAAPLLVEFPELTVTLAGDDSQRDESGRTYADGLVDLVPDADTRRRVRFAGKVDDAELARRYEACDIVVVPSRYESFGLTAVEGMMRSKPVVASAVGGLVDIVEDGESGLLVSPPTSADSLRSALRRLIGDPGLRRRMGDHGRELADLRYSREAMAAGAEAHYLRLVDRRPRRSVRRRDPFDGAPDGRWSTDGAPPPVPRAGTASSAGARR